MDWKEKYVEEIVEAVEYCAVVGGSDKIMQVIQRIYDRGFDDGLEECSDSAGYSDEPVNISELMQDLD